MVYSCKLVCLSGASISVNGVNVHPVPKLECPFSFTHPCIPAPNTAYLLSRTFPNSDLPASGIAMLTSACHRPFVKTSLRLDLNCSQHEPDMIIT